MESAMFTAFNNSLSLPLSISLIKQAGFDHIALDGRKRDYFYCATAEGREEIRKICKENDIGICSVHAPFPEGDNLFSIQEDKRIDSLNRCITSTMRHQK